MGTMGFAGGRGFVLLEKAGWVGNLKSQPRSDPKQRSDIALMTSCRAASGPLEKAVNLGAEAILGADWSWLSPVSQVSKSSVTSGWAESPKVGKSLTNW